MAQQLNYCLPVEVAQQLEELLFTCESAVPGLKWHSNLKSYCLPVEVAQQLEELMFTCGSGTATL